MISVLLPFDLMVKKDYGFHMFPHKPKPLCSCWVGDKIVDMYVKFDFEKYKVDWSKAYKGSFIKGSPNLDVFDWLNEFEVCDDSELENFRVDEYFNYYSLYLH